MKAKQHISPYEALVAFANEPQITKENWRVVLDRLGDWRFPYSSDHALSWGQRFGWLVPETLEGISGPESLDKIHRELRGILERLTDPTQDLLPPLRGIPEAYREKPPKTVDWLLDKINALSGEGLSLPLFLQGRRRLPRLRLTDPVYFVPLIEDLRIWIYFCLASLWVDGLLPRVGRCQNPKCERFFFAKTKAKKLFCSQQCAQRKDASQRTKDSRARDAEWNSAREELRRALENMKTLHRTTERAALERAEKALKKTEDSFKRVGPRRKGPRYDEEKALLTQAKEQIQRLHKKVKGY